MVKNILMKNNILLFSLTRMTTVKLELVDQDRRVCCTRGRNQVKKLDLIENVSQLQYRYLLQTWINEIMRTLNIIQLGQDSFPINPLPTCKLSRTQADPRSSIRACMCTQDFCNIVDDGKLKLSLCMFDADPKMNEF